MTILCPLDFSAASSGLVAHAAALAVANGAALRLLHVCEPQENAAGPVPAPGEVVPCVERLAGLRAEAERAGVAHVHTAIARGEAATEIIAEARRQQVDLIVIGAHGRTGLTRFLMGTTAEIVLRTARCATLLVRAPLPTKNEG